MKKITFSANEALIKRARRIARLQGRTLNEAILEWLESYAGKVSPLYQYEQLMKRLRHLRPGRTFSREEMNER